MTDNNIIITNNKNIIHNQVNDIYEDIINSQSSNQNVIVHHKIFHIDLE